MSDKRWLASMLIALMLVPSGIGLNTQMANAAPGSSNEFGPGDNTDPAPPGNVVSPFNISIKRLAKNQNDGDGIIMNDNEVHPQSFEQAKAMAWDPPKDRTGWSTAGSVCERIIAYYRYYDKDGNSVSSSGNWVRSEPVYESTWYSGYDSYGPSIGAFQHATFNQLDINPIENYIGQLKSKYAPHPDYQYVRNWDSVRGNLAGIGGSLEWWTKLNLSGESASEPCQTGDTKWIYANTEIVMMGNLQEHIDDPTSSKPSPGRNDGDVKGDVYWELVRHDESRNSGVDAYSNLKMNGNHYATRNFKQSLQLGNQNKTQKEPINLSVIDGMTVKNQDLKYGITYEYTNYYIDKFKCVDSEKGYCYEWQFVERVPDWNKVKTFTYNNSIKINHRMEETITGSKLEDVLQTFVVGGSDKINSKTSKTNTPFTEEFAKTSGNKNKSDYALKTQTHIPITPGAINYKVSVPSGKHSAGNYKVMLKEKSAGSFTPPDMDKSLVADYGESGYPYQQSSMKDNGINGGKRNFEWDYVTDLFYMTQHTGYQQGYDYTSKMKANMMNNSTAQPPMPTYNSMMTQVKNQYKHDTGQTLLDDDKLLYANSASDILKLQRYMIPVYGTSPLKPKTVHTIKMTNEKMGLNDLKFNYNRTFKFDRYLFGSGADDAWIIEQRDSLAHPTDPNPDKNILTGVSKSDMKTIHISYEELKQLAAENDKTVRTTSQVHDFRVADRNLLSAVIPLHAIS